MEAKRTRKRWTYAEYARLPMSGATRYEVIDGELCVTPSPAVRHQRIVMRLGALLHDFVRSNDLGEVLPGPVDVLFAEGDYLQPDLVYVSKQRLELVSDRGIEGPPDLVVEVTSPSTMARDRGIKLERYRHFGVGAYWIVDAQARTFEVWDLAGGADAPGRLTASDRYSWTPGRAALDIDLGELFSEEKRP